VVTGKFVILTGILQAAKIGDFKMPGSVKLRAIWATLKKTMPTLEIASINSTGLGLNQADFDIAIIEESKLESHRGLFYDFLRQQKGVIIHIGNPDFKDNKKDGFFAGEIIDWSFKPGTLIIPEYDPINPTSNKGANQEHGFKFIDQYRSDLDKLLKIGIDKSPIKKVYFLSDCQFGPEKESFEKIYTLTDFWERHDREGLVFNTIYELYGE
jgi:hypothetical protein